MLQYVFFFFNDTATTEIYTLSLHDALPISQRALLDLAGSLGGDAQHLPGLAEGVQLAVRVVAEPQLDHPALLLGEFGDGLLDRKSTRLNSSHANISYAVFCLKKKKKT